ncbi:MAG: hypothetical protein JWL80_91 [Parcubacteria group bacterium]|nr:hypothetical protein [Parcubacteria group bacterium]
MKPTRFAVLVVASILATFSTTACTEINYYGPTSPVSADSTTKAPVATFSAPMPWISIPFGGTGPNKVVACIPAGSKITDLVIYSNSGTARSDGVEWSHPFISTVCATGLDEYTIFPRVYGSAIGTATIRFEIHYTTIDSTVVMKALTWDVFTYDPFNQKG